jgi:LasA protease
MQKRSIGLIICGILIVLSACVRNAPGAPEWKPGDVLPVGTNSAVGDGTPTPSFHLPAPRLPGSAILTPTPDSPHSQPTARSGPEQYIVQYEDTLGGIAIRYSVRLGDLMQSNGLSDPNNIYVGQELVIPLPSPQASGPENKIIPDSELVYGPMSITLDINGFIQSHGGYLSNYHEEVDGNYLDGAQIITLVSQNYSVNPKLLLALLEYRSGWLTKIQPEANTLNYPLGIQDNFHSGLYRQLTWAANNLNRGFYLWQVNALSGMVLADGSLVPISPVINSGTAGVQFLFSNFDNIINFQEDVSPDGFFALYNHLFGYSFDYAIDPIVPLELMQPEMVLPFEEGQTWAFTGGPHAGWDSGSAWAALDFAPPGEPQGCAISDSWITAVADGLIVRSDNGSVMLDLDGDGFEQTGWVVLYLHIDSIGRVAAGNYLKAGDRIGHPSCEGGVSKATHAHLARKFNGEWIPADGPVPFNLDGWVSSGTGVEYDGFLTRNDQSVEAFNGTNPINQIQR